MIYKLGECSYCGNTYSIIRPTPFMADAAADMCKVCWDDTQEEYASSNGDYIGNFGDAGGYKEVCKKELEEISKVLDDQRGMADILTGLDDKESYDIVKVLGWLESLYSFKYMEMESGK